VPYESAKSFLLVGSAKATLLLFANVKVSAVYENFFTFNRLSSVFLLVAFFKFSFRPGSNLSLSGKQKIRFLWLAGTYRSVS